VSTPFERAAKKASAAVDAVFGEAFDFIAMKSPGDVDAKRVPDGTRPSFTAVGGYLGPSHSVLPHARGSIQEDSAHKLAISTPRVSVDNARMPWTVVAGDHVRRQKTGEVYEVAKPLPDGVTRTMFTLTARKRIV
jgi:hypothetical protein